MSASKWEKLQRGGEVAVLYSPGYGAGWYTWNDDDGLVFDSEIAEAVLAGDNDKAAEIAARKYPDAFLGGADDLAVEWVPAGARFRIDEYDGSERVEIIGASMGLVA